MMFTCSLNSEKRIIYLRKVLTGMLLKTQPFKCEDTSFLNFIFYIYSSLILYECEYIIFDHFYSSIIIIAVMLHSVIVILLLFNAYNKAERLIGSHIVGTDICRLSNYFAQLIRYFDMENEHQVISIRRIRMMHAFGPMVLVS